VGDREKKENYGGPMKTRSTIKLVEVAASHGHTPLNKTQCTAERKGRTRFRQRGDR